MKQLIEQAKNGNRNSLQELLAMHQKLIESVARRFAYEQVEQRDIVQNICVRVISSIADYKEAAQFPTWLYRIAINECMEANRRHLRLHNRYEKPTMPLELFPDPNATDGLSHTSTRETAAVLQSIIAALPEGMQKAIALFYIEEMTGAEAAEKLGITLQAFFVRLSAARARLRQELAKKGVCNETESR